MSRSCRSRRSLTYFSASPVCSTPSSMCSTREEAPPCSGPDIAPMAPDSEAATSAPVEAMTRAVKVEAFMPCSAADVQYASTAATWRGSGSEEHTSELQSRQYLVCRLLLEKKKNT